MGRAASLVDMPQCQQVKNLLLSFDVLGLCHLVAKRFCGLANRSSGRLPDHTELRFLPMREEKAMRPTLPFVLAIASSMAMAAPVVAQDAPGDVASGRHLAETMCADCHQIDFQQPKAAARAPGFVQIAKMPSTTGLALNVFLKTSHDVMPNYILSRQESDDIVAFILSLKDR